jgi:hypothetical protein
MQHLPTPSINNVRVSKRLPLRIKPEVKRLRIIVRPMDLLFAGDALPKMREELSVYFCRGMI